MAVAVCVVVVGRWILGSKKKQGAAWLHYQVCVCVCEGERECVRGRDCPFQASLRKTPNGCTSRTREDGESPSQLGMARTVKRDDLDVGAA